jgi:predicted nuclease of restriction endonuclease-like (RecB) superfamily
MKRKVLNTKDYVNRIREILKTARMQSLSAVNATMVAAYWHIGKEIVEEEQRGNKRADYGKRVLQELAGKLIIEFGKGFSLPNLRNMRQFYLTYSDRTLSIRQAVPSELIQAVDIVGNIQIRQAVPSELNTLDLRLSWTHYCLLIRVARKEARNFYEIECIKSNWSTRELERQIHSLLFDRLAKSRDKKGALALANKGHEVFHPLDLIKDPYVLEFTGLPEPPHFTESQLEEALITRLQHFLLELGKDIMFVARQKRITIDGDHFYIDLVFYHRELRCFILIDLKTGKLTQQDVGQMLLYTGYYKVEVTRKDENPPIGLILCTEKNDAAVRYTLNDSNRKIFTSKYQMHLPSVEELTEELIKERAAIENRLAIEKK